MKGKSYKYLFLYSAVDEVALRTYDSLMAFLKSLKISDYEVQLIDVKKEPGWLFKYNILALPAAIQVTPGPGFVLTGDISIDDFSKAQPIAHA
ncbi:MAG: hypothetical protein Kow0037_04430 [Calditrichia bacterium]